MDRFAQMIVAAARQAEADSGLDIAPEADRDRRLDRDRDRRAPGVPGLLRRAARARARPREPVLDPGDHPEHGRRPGSRWSSARAGPLSSQCTACAASNMAIGEARGRDPARPRRRRCSRGGTEARDHARSASPGFGAMRALSRRNDEPEQASRPFDAGRDGFVMGEAGGVVVLEELEHAQARGAKIYAELLGYGALVGRAAHHRAGSDRREPGAGDDRWRSTDAGDRRPSEVDYINAHGTSTPLGDASETRVIKLALGEENARKTPVSSTKGATGHCLGRGRRGRGDLHDPRRRARTCCRRRSTTRTPDPECDLDYIPNEAREAEVEVAVSNSFGFGGHNACIVLRELDD